MIILKLKKLQCCKKFNIADETLQYGPSGQLQRTIPGYRIEFRNMEYKITDKEREKVQKQFGVDIIEKIKETADYKANYIEIIEEKEETKEEPKKPGRPKKEKE